MKTDAIDYASDIFALCRESPVRASLLYTRSECAELNLEKLWVTLSSIVASNRIISSKNLFNKLECYVLKKLLYKLNHALRRLKLYHLLKRLRRFMEKSRHVLFYEALQLFIEGIEETEVGGLHFPSLEVWTHTLGRLFATAICMASVMECCVQIASYCCQTLSDAHFPHQCCLLLACAAVLFENASRNVQLLEQIYQQLSNWHSVKLKARNADYSPPVWPSTVLDLPTVGRAMKSRVADLNGDQIKEYIGKLRTVVKQWDREFMDDLIEEVVHSKPNEANEQLDLGQPMSRESFYPNVSQLAAQCRQIKSLKSLHSFGKYLSRTSDTAGHSQKIYLQIHAHVRRKLVKILRLKKSDPKEAIVLFKKTKRVVWKLLKKQSLLSPNAKKSNCGRNIGVA